MDKVQEIPPATSYQTENSVPPQTFKARISSLFQKTEPFEKKFSKRLDKIIPLSVEIYTNSNKYKFIRACFTKHTLKSYYENASREKEARNFIKRFEANYDRKQKSMDKLLNIIKTNENLNKAFQIINNRFKSATDPDKQLAIAKIQELLNKTFKLSPSDEQTSSTKKSVKRNKFAPTLPSLLEEEESITRLNIHPTRL